MAAIKISDTLYSVGVLNPNLRVFDIVMATEYGTTYNSFLIKGEKNVLVETCHDTYFDAFIENIREVMDPGDIDYIVLNHTEPDHSGVLAKLYDFCPQAKIFCSQAAAMFLKNITNRNDLNLQVVQQGERLELGDNSLEFIIAPFLHWPDSMFTWMPEHGILFSCDFLGAHYCEPRMLDRYITYPQKYEIAFKNYYDAIFGPFPTYVQDGLKKIEDLDIRMVCTSHGPIITKDGLLDYVRDMYSQWSAPKKNPVPTIPIFYCSAYGNTGKMAQAMQQGILQAIPSAKVDIYDIIEHDMASLAAQLNTSDAFCLGSPTLNRDAVPPVWQLLSHIDAVNIQKRPVAVFGSYGWSGEAVPALVQRLNTLRLRVFEKGYRATFVPSETQLEECKAYGKAFAQSLQ